MNSDILRLCIFICYLFEIAHQVKAKNISGRRLKVEYGFRKIRTRTLLEPNQIIEIDEFDFSYLDRLGVFRNNEMAIINEDSSAIDRMAQAKQDVEGYINNK